MIKAFFMVDYGKKDLNEYSSLVTFSKVAGEIKKIKTNLGRY